MLANWFQTSDIEKSLTEYESNKPLFIIWQPVKIKSFRTSFLILFFKRLKSPFNFFENVIKKDVQNDLIYTGCQIINKDLFDSHLVSDFSISKIWNQLINKNKLYGYESLENFYHLTNLEIYEELLKNN